MKQSKLRVDIRPMTIDDLKAVYIIETAAYPKPWPVKCFLDELTINRFARYVVAVPEDGAIAGYAGLWLISDEVHITNIAVSQDLRRRGIAEQLLLNQIDFSLMKNAKSIYLEVRRFNIAAQRMYTRYRFVPVRVRQAYYPDNGEDAIELRVEDLTDPAFLAVCAKRKNDIFVETGVRSGSPGKTPV